MTRAGFTGTATLIGPAIDPGWDGYGTVYQLDPPYVGRIGTATVSAGGLQPGAALFPTDTLGFVDQTDVVWAEILFPTDYTDGISAEDFLGSLGYEVASE